MLKKILSVIRGQRPEPIRVRPDAPSNPLPSKIATEIVVPGRLSVHIYHHELGSVDGPVTCWTYVSHGLWQLGQKEILISVKRETEEREDEYPRGLLTFYAAVDGMALQSRYVEVGGFSTLAPESGGFLRRPEFRAIVYAPPQRLGLVEESTPCLTGLILTAGEFQVAQEFGLVRLMATLGRQYRFFPTAPWADRLRSELVSPSDMKASILSKIRRSSCQGVVAYVQGGAATATPLPSTGSLADQRLSIEDQVVVIELTPQGRETMAEVLAKLPLDQPIAILTAPDPHADACRCWQPGMEGLVNISAPRSTGRRIAGNFLAILPAADRNSILLVEDGFAARLTPDTWSNLRRAIRERQAVWVAPCDEKPGFRMQLAEDGARPASPVSAERFAGFSRLGATVLVTPELEIAQRVEVEDFARFSNSVAEVVEDWAAHRASYAGRDLAIECEVTPGGTMGFKFIWRHAGDVQGDTTLRDQLQRLTPPPVRIDAITFQLIFAIWGGTGQSFFPGPGHVDAQA